MKKSLNCLLVFSTMLMIAISCGSKDEPESKPDPKLAPDPTPVVDESPYVFSVKNASADASIFALKDGDMLRLAHGTSLANYTISSSSVSVPSDELSAGDLVCGWYPATEDESASSVVFTIGDQAQTGSSFTKSLMPMMAIPISVSESTERASAGTLELNALAGVIAFKLYATDSNRAGDTVVSLTFDSSSALAGAFLCDATSSNIPSIAGLEETSITTTLANAPEMGSSASNAMTVYMVVAPGSYTGKVTLVTKTLAGEEAYYYFDVNDAIAVSRGQIGECVLNLDSVDKLGAEIIVNGDFEGESLPSNWQIGGSKSGEPSIVTEADGNRVCSFAVSSTSGNYWEAELHYYFDSALTSDKTYKAMIDVKGSVEGYQGNHINSIAIQSTHDDWDKTNTQFDNDEWYGIKPTTEWRTLELTFTPPMDRERFSICYGDYIDGTLYIDNLSIRQLYSAAISE